MGNLATTCINAGQLLAAGHKILFLSNKINVFYYFLSAPRKRAFLSSEIVEQFIHKLIYYQPLASNKQLWLAEETSY
jgi:hypothetical protein